MSFSSPLDTEGVLLAPLVPFGEVQVLSLFCASCIFKLWLCFCAQRSKHRFLVPQDYPFPQQFAAELRGGWGARGWAFPLLPCFCLSLFSFAILSVFCVAETVQLALNSPRGILLAVGVIWCFVEGVNSRSSYVTFLDQNFFWGFMEALLYRHE